MKRFLKWLGKVVGTALSLVLVIIMLPYATKWIGKLLPDGSRNAITVSAVLSRQMEASSRLETAKIEDEGVISSSVDALFIGQVQNVVIQYRYEASMGIDLKKVKMQILGNVLTLELPPVEVLADSLTPLNVERNDFWFPLSEERRLKLLEDERLKCRAHYLEENQENRDAFDYSVAAMTEWLDQLLKETGRQGVEIVCVQQKAPET
ncbi:MAG: DUF4230 domain-containing protein [Clostridia bacterium]|nr:DUF4230 domain-containing protein [Clostridia bacterium]MBR0217027.1 DUF4230 domain-containing protein [Clostridia bacterium]